MKKYTIILLLVLSHSHIQPMNEKESERIVIIRADTNKFENLLLDDTWKTEETGYNLNLQLSKFWNSNFEPINFFKSCYYKFHQKLTIIKLKMSSTLLNMYQNTHIDGYSALSAAMLAKNISHDEKRNFIQKLINLNVKPTAKDIELAELYLCDTITAKKTLLHILHDQSKSNWSTLPHDIKKQIVHYLIQLFKKDAWLLPEKSEQEEEEISYCIRGRIVEII